MFSYILFICFLHFYPFQVFNSAKDDSTAVVSSLTSDGTSTSASTEKHIPYHAADGTTMEKKELSDLTVDEVVLLFAFLDLDRDGSYGAVIREKKIDGTWLGNIFSPQNLNDKFGKNIPAVRLLFNQIMEFRSNGVSIVLVTVDRNQVRLILSPFYFYFCFWNLFVVICFIHIFLILIKSDDGILKIIIIFT